MEPHYLFCNIVSYPTKPFMFSRTTGLYIKTLAKIIQEDLTQFIAVFIVIFLPSRCALFLSLRQGSNQRLWWFIPTYFYKLLTYIKLLRAVTFASFYI